MFNFNTGGSRLKRYKDDLSGNIGPMFAICSVFVLGTMGAAMDFATLKSAENRSQSIADATALAAAIFVKTHGRKPLEPAINEDGSSDPEEGFQHMKVYKASDLGYEFKGWVEGGGGEVEIVVNYDDNAKEAIVTVSGTTRPALVHVFDSHGPDGGDGHANASEGLKAERQAKRKRTMTFEARAVVSYYEIEDAFPASIALVLDNSGSMRWDDRQVDQNGDRPDGANSRIAGLKTSVNTFRTDMQTRLGDQIDSDGKRILRTGILPYNSQIIAQTNGLNRQMEWGYAGINSSKVSSMNAAGGTNSNPPMAKAMQWLAAEDEYHRREAENTGDAYRQPLKFVVFMTDGQNSVGNQYFIEDEDSPHEYTFHNGRWYAWLPQYPSWYREYFGFEKGYLRRTADRDTIASCKAMHEQGTEVYTIAYGLDIGNYYDPYYDTPPPGDNYPYARTQRVTAEVNSAAVALMQECASDPGKFIMASDGRELEGAFDQIQNEIVKELIRIKT